MTFDSHVFNLVDVASRLVNELTPGLRGGHEVSAPRGSARVEAGSGTYRVLVGPWTDQGAAERSRRAVVSRGYPDAQLISGG